MTFGRYSQDLKDKGRKALVVFFTAGYPDEVTFCRLVRAAAEAGCDAIEIGIPFSDPIADGPLIQQSSKAAMEDGITLARVFGLTRELASEVRIPLLYMTYVNPILRLGVERFAGTAVEAGVSGLIIPDVPLEESDPIRSAMKPYGLSYIDFIAPTSSIDRIDRISRVAEGFLYLVAVTGVTGARSPEAQNLVRFVGRVRHRTALPLYLGFGIASTEHALAAARYSDGVIIGSALIRIAASSASRDEAVNGVGRFLRDVRGALDRDGRAAAKG